MNAKDLKSYNASDLCLTLYKIVHDVVCSEAHGKLMSFP